MDEIKPGLFIPGIRIPGCFDSFEMSVEAVLGQQITVKAATTLAGRLAERYVKPVETGIYGLSLVFPMPQDILTLGDSIEEHLGPLGIIAARARTIRALAETTVEKLIQLPGIGPWTAQYIAMRTLGWTDAFPDTDLGLKKALAPRSRKEIQSNGVHGRAKQMGVAYVRLYIRRIERSASRLAVHAP